MFKVKEACTSILFSVPVVRLKKQFILKLKKKTYIFPSFLNEETILMFALKFM